MSTTETERPQAVYALGHTPEEYERLRMQARIWQAACWASTRTLRSAL